MEDETDSGRPVFHRGHTVFSDRWVRRRSIASRDLRDETTQDRSDPDPPRRPRPQSRRQAHPARRLAEPASLARRSLGRLPQGPREDRSRKGPGRRRDDAADHRSAARSEDAELGRDRRAARRAQQAGRQSEGVRPRHRLDRQADPERRADRHIAQADAGRPDADPPQEHRRETATGAGGFSFEVMFLGATLKDPAVRRDDTQDSRRAAVSERRRGSRRSTPSFMPRGRRFSATSATSGSSPTSRPRSSRRSASSIRRRSRRSC